MPPSDASLSAGLPSGLETMSPAMADMQAYPRYLFNAVAPYLGRRVWELGVGHGRYTRWLLDANRSVLATDLDAACVQQVAHDHAGNPQLRSAIVDLTVPETILAQRDFHADSILCFNVLEHIKDDISALTHLREAVAPGATLCLIVPAHPQLLGQMDREAGHFRRYTRTSLAHALTRAGWRVDCARYLNLLGAAGWWYHNRWRRGAGLADATVNQQMRLVDRWLPRLARFTDPLFGRFAGLSVLAIARKPLVAVFDPVPLNHVADPQV